MVKEEKKRYTAKQQLGIALCKICRATRYLRTGVFDGEMDEGDFLWGQILSKTDGAEEARRLPDEIEGHGEEDRKLLLVFLLVNSGQLFWYRTRSG